MGLAEFVTLAGQYGLWNAVAAVASLVAVVILMQWSRTRNALATTAAATRGDVARSEAASELKLTEAIVELAKKIGNADENSRAERTQMMLTIQQMIGRMEGMMSVVVDNTKAVKGTGSSVDTFGNQLDEFGLRIQHLPQMKTDLQELVGKANSIQAGFNGALDERFAPLLSMMMSFGTQLNNVAANGIAIIELLTTMNTLLQPKGEKSEEPLPQTD